MSEWDVWSSWAFTWDRVTTGISAIGLISSETLLLSEIAVLLFELSTALATTSKLICPEKCSFASIPISYGFGQLDNVWRVAWLFETETLVPSGATRFWTLDKFEKSKKSVSDPSASFNWALIVTLAKSAELLSFTPSSEPPVPIAAVKSGVSATAATSIVKVADDDAYLSALWAVIKRVRSIWPEKSGLKFRKSPCKSEIPVFVFRV